MSAAAWRMISQRPATFSDLCRRTQIAGICSFRCPSGQEMTEAAVWMRSTPAPFSSSRGQTSYRFLLASAGWLRLPAGRKGRIFTLHEPTRFYYSAGRVCQFGTANQQPASLSDLRCVPQISGPCSSRSTSAQAMTEKVEWRRPTSRTLSSSQEPAGWWRRKAAWNSRIYALHEPARFFLSGFGQARAFGTANQPQRQATKQHLYLVLDDQEDAYSIYKLDIDNDPEVGCISTATPLLLPEPPLDVGSISEETPMRLPEQPLPKPRIRSIDYNTVSKGAKFAAIGSHIIAISPYTKGKCVTLTFNTKTAKLIVSHVLPQGLICGYDTAIAVRDRLYVFESFTDLSDGLDGSYFRGGLHCLSEGACVDDERHWGWQPISNFSPFVWSWSLSRGTPKLPFGPKTITGHAVHPKTGTIFVSVGGHVSFGTFSYVFRGCSQWKCLGDWLLPFKGPAHYDEALEAWVGLHLSVDTGDADGYLCATSVMSDSQQPNLKVGRDMLFLKDPYWSRVDAKLVHMGEHNSKYCLVERLQPKGADKMKYVLRLTTFIVKYDKDGDLKIMAPQPARLYKAPSYCCCFDIHAFWM